MCMWRRPCTYLQSLSFGRRQCQLRVLRLHHLLRRLTSPSAQPLVIGGTCVQGNGHTGGAVVRWSRVVSGGQWCDCCSGPHCTDSCYRRQPKVLDKGVWWYHMFPVIGTRNTHLSTTKYKHICCWPPSVSRDNGFCALSVSVRVAAAPALTVQSDPWATYSDTVAAFEGLRTWLSGCFCHLLLTFLFLLPLLPSPPLTRADACPDSSPPTTAVCGLGSLVCWVDAACLHVTFADISKPKDKPSCGSGASGELPIQSTLKDSSILHSPLG